MSKFILVSGAPGAGKTTFSSPLVEKLKCVYLEIDSLGNPFTLERDHDYKVNVEPFIIQGLLNLAKDNLKLGNDVLMDLPWTLFFKENPRLIGQITNIASDTNAELYVFECCVPEKVLFDHILNRNEVRDYPKIKDGYKGNGWNNFIINIAFGIAQQLPHTRIDTTKPSAENVNLALEAIGEIRQAKKIKRCISNT